MRKSPIEGTWYNRTAEGLRKQIEDLFLDKKFGKGKLPDHKDSNPDLLGVISPHAGYIYSGSVASHGYYELAVGKPDTDCVIIIGPDHKSIGSPISLYPGGYWSTPLGEIEIDPELTDFAKTYDFMKLKNDVTFNKTAYTYEHSIDIQIPFLQFIYQNQFTFFPICLGNQQLDPFGKAIGKFISSIMEHFKDKKIVIVASTDLSHEYNFDLVEVHDAQMVKTIETGETEKIDSLRKRLPVTMCGYGSVYGLLECASMINPNFNVETLKYSNSGRITNKKNDYTVGYYSAMVEI